MPSASAAEPSSGLIPGTRSGTHQQQADALPAAAAGIAGNGVDSAGLHLQATTSALATTTLPVDSDSLRRGSSAAAGAIMTAEQPATQDDEFRYAFEGDQREQEFFKREYTPEPLPPHLVTDVSPSLTVPANTIKEEEGEGSSDLEMLNESDADAEDDSDADAENAHLDTSAVQPVDAGAYESNTASSRSSPSEPATQPARNASEPSGGANVAIRSPGSGGQAGSPALPSALAAAFGKAAQPGVGTNSALRAAAVSSSSERSAASPPAVQRSAGDAFAGHGSSGATATSKATPPVAPDDLPLDTMFSAPKTQRSHPPAANAQPAAQPGSPAKTQFGHAASHRAAAQSQPSVNSSVPALERAGERGQVDIAQPSDVLAPSYSRVEVEAYISEAGPGTRSSGVFMPGQVNAGAGADQKAGETSDGEEDIEFDGIPGGEGDVHGARQPAANGSANQTTARGVYAASASSPRHAAAAPRTQPLASLPQPTQRLQGLAGAGSAHTIGSGDVSPRDSLPALRPIKTAHPPSSTDHAQPRSARAASPRHAPAPTAATPAATAASAPLASPASPRTPHQPPSSSFDGATTTEVRAIVRELSMEPRSPVATFTRLDSAVAPEATPSSPQAGKPTLFQRVLSRLSSKSTKLPPHIAHERDRVLTLSAKKFDNANELHVRSLDTLYQRCARAPCPGRYGAHWECLGFQGSDPATDLRGSGMLAVAQMLQLFAYNSDNAGVVWQLGQVPDKVCLQAKNALVVAQVMWRA
jgi:ELMO/CED-12 family